MPLRSAVTGKLSEADLKFFVVFNPEGAMRPPLLALVMPPLHPPPTSQACQRRLKEGASRTDRHV